jgi:hypothetical protein
MIQLDEKPEKGERKMADEMALLIAEIIEEWLAGDKEMMLYKVALMEIAFEYSNYNFDI